MKPIKIKNIVALCMATLVAFSPTVSVMAADYRDAGKFAMVKDSSVIVSQNGSSYYFNGTGGLTVYVPYSGMNTGKEIFTQMFTGLFDIYKTGIGSLYSSAGAKYNAPSGHSNINGVQTNYFVKKVSLGGLATNLGPAVTSAQGKTDLKNFEPKYNVEFRYAGIMVDSSGKGDIVTNPGFPADTLSASNNGDVSRDYIVYDKAGQSIDTVKLFGTSEYVVLQRSWLTQDWSGMSGVPTSRKSIYNDNEEIARKTFEKWADTTEIGNEFRKVYSTDPSGRPWWSVLNDYMRIDGDYTTQSVLFTVVFNYQGHKYYKTYGIPYPIENNMIASKIQILDDSKTLLDYSERSLSIEEAITGATVVNTNVMTGSAVKLEMNKTYHVEAAFVYLSEKQEKSNTPKDSSAAVPNFSVYDQTLTENNFQNYNSMLTSNIQEMTSEERSLADTTTSGPIRTKKTKEIGFTNPGRNP